MNAKPSEPFRYPNPLRGGLLIGGAGFVDAVGYLLLGRVFVANMSGNTIALGVHLAHRHWGDALARASPIVAFVPGLIAGAMIVAAARRLKLRSHLAPALAVEALFLAVFLLLGLASAGNWGTLEVTESPGGPLLVGLAAMAMGIQNGALRRVGALTNVHTYVTGMLLASAEGFTDFLFWLGGSKPRQSHRPGGRSAREYLVQPDLRKAVVSGCLWASYLVGAVAGASALLAYGLVVMLAPLLLLGIMIVAEILRPVGWSLPPPGQSESNDC